MRTHLKSSSVYTPSTLHSQRAMRRCTVLRVKIARRDACVSVAFARTLSTSRASHERWRISTLLEHEQPVDDVEVAGWVRTVRRQKHIAFLALGDGSAYQSLQAVLRPEHAEGLAPGIAVKLKGNWTQSTGKGQSKELKVIDVQVQGANDAESNPLQPKYQTSEYLRTIPHLRTRLSLNTVVLRLRSEIIATITQWFHEQKFIQCHTPIITSSDCEGAGEVFTVTAGTKDKDAEPFFKTPKYLTVSGQLHLEALSQAVDKVWTLSPTFRAEKSDTPRHLSEFYMLEAELCFIDSASEVMDVVEGMLRNVAQKLQMSKVKAELLEAKSRTNKDENWNATTATELEQRWKGLAAPDWPRITYDEAIGVLKAAQSSGQQSFTIKPSYADGLAAEHERYLATAIGMGRPIFVTRYPAIQKPFYMAPGDAGSRTVPVADCFDLLVPELCELAGGSMREHRAEELALAMNSKQVSGQALDWYQDLRKYGTVPHGGFGLGFDRLICYLSGVSNVRDIVAFPRWYGRADC